MFVDKKVSTLLESLLQIPSGCNVYIPNLTNSWNIAREIGLRSSKISGYTEDKALRELIESELGRYSQETVIGQFINSKIEESFHVSFSVPEYNIDLSSDVPVTEKIIKDRLLLYNTSRGRKERMVPYQLALLECMLHATAPGGYFSCVLPKNWMGREMTFLRWWQKNAATVAKINLPESSVYVDKEIRKIVPYGPFDNNLLTVTPFGGYEEHKDTIQLAVPGDWCLFIWFRPFILDDSHQEKANSTAKNILEDWAIFRYTPFEFTLESLTNKSIDECAENFRMHDWWRNNIFFWRKMLEEYPTHSIYGTQGSIAKSIPSLENAWFFEETDDNRCRLEVRSIEKIKRSSRSVQVIPAQNKVKLVAHNIQSRGSLHEIMLSDGVRVENKQGKPSKVVYEFNEKYLKSNLSLNQEQIISRIIDYEMIPCITEQDAHKVVKQQRWLDIQLAPNERIVPIKRSDGSTYWEEMYEDTGIGTVFPEVINLWRQRALKMKMDQYLHDFQLEDVVRMACKNSILNGNVMGLGKTREVLFSALLRCTERMLIVAPKRLIGRWQDEIEEVVVPYIRRIKRNWQGKIIQGGQPHIIEHGEDCLTENLGLFNIISYDKLKATPRDGRFYLCPECKNVVYSKRGTPQICPGHPMHLKDNDFRHLACGLKISQWKEKCRKRNEHGELLFRKYKVWVGKNSDSVSVSNGKKVHWDENHHSRKNYPEDECVIVDTRPPRPSSVAMERQDKMFKKMNVIKIGSVKDKDTGIITPTYKIKQKKTCHTSWTFSDLLRNKFNIIAADEILYVANQSSLRTQAFTHLTSKSRWGITGTPMKGNPQNIVPYFNWIFKRSVFPEYRNEGGVSRFLKYYKTEVKIGDENGEGQVKQVPKINNPELFQAEMSPLMIRHLRNEPIVLKSIPEKKIVQEDITVEMDPTHREYYKKWIVKFSEWWQKMKEEEEGRMVRPGDILTKLTYLIGASSNPHYMLEGIKKSKDKEFKTWAAMIGVYKGPPTAKELKCRELIQESIKCGDKTIVFGIRKRQLDRGYVWSKNNNVYSMIVDGRVSLNTLSGETRSKRHLMIDKFRTHGYHVLWAGMEALNEGMDIPEANRGIIIGYTWEPKHPAQAVGRMLRPQQTKTVYDYRLMHKGTIDEYMGALCYLKGRSHTEGIDYMEFDDFSSDLIPDVRQYAESIVDGTENILKRTMWLAVEHLKKQIEEEGEGGKSDLLDEDE